MAAAAQRLQVLEVVRVAAAAQQHDVIDIQAARPAALAAPPAVALEDLPPRRPPAPRPQYPVVVTAHRVTGPRTLPTPRRIREDAREPSSGQDAARRYCEREHNRYDDCDRQQNEVDADYPLGEIPRAGQADDHDRTDLLGELRLPTRR